jgi:hypothetical protein
MSGDGIRSEAARRILAIGRGDFRWGTKWLVDDQPGIHELRKDPNLETPI